MNSPLLGGGCKLQTQYQHMCDMWTRTGVGTILCHNNTHTIHTDTHTIHTDTYTQHTDTHTHHTDTHTQDTDTHTHTGPILTLV